MKGNKLEWTGTREEKLDWTGMKENKLEGNGMREEEMEGIGMREMVTGNGEMRHDRQRGKKKGEGEPM